MESILAKEFAETCERHGIVGWCDDCQGEVDDEWQDYQVKQMERHEKDNYR